jgi:hypothetical protein
MSNASEAGLAAVGIEPKSRAVAPTRHSRRLVKRALFGLVLWVTLVAGGACLLHASIEADSDPAGRSYSDKADPVPSREWSTRGPVSLGSGGPQHEVRVPS